MASGNSGARGELQAPRCMGGLDFRISAFTQKPMKRNKILILPIAFNRSELVLSRYDPTAVPPNLDRSLQCANPRPLGPKPYKAQFSFTGTPTQAQRINHCGIPTVQEKRTIKQTINPANTPLTTPSWSLNTHHYLG